MDKIKMHFMFNDMNLSFKEIGTAFGISALDVLRTLEQVEQKKKEHLERVRTRYSFKNRVNGCWVVVNGNLKRRTA